VQPWADAGYLCYCVDLQHPPGETREDNIIRVGIDLREWLPPYGPVAFAAFFPPCTDTAISGRAHFRRKGLGSVFKALQLFEWSARLAAWCQCPYFIENPVSTVSTYWRPPDPPATTPATFPPSASSAKPTPSALAYGPAVAFNYPSTNP
jgi:hypothetical protein